MRTCVLSGSEPTVYGVRPPTSGNPGEAAVMGAFITRGYDVFLPFGGGQPFDLAVHIEGSTCLRVQCKTAWKERGCLLFNCLATDHGDGPKSYAGLADVFGVYYPPSESVYLVPIWDVAPTQGRLRLEPTLNNQRKRIRLAEDYAIKRWSRDEFLGLCEVAAQLGGRSEQPDHGVRVPALDGIGAQREVPAFE